MTDAAEGTARRSLAKVLGNRNLRRIQLAFFGSLLGDWAYAIALTVWAYDDGGAASVGAFQAARFIAMAVAGPVGSVIADRIPRKTFMMLTDAIRAVLVALAAVLITTGGPSWAVYALGIVVAMVGAPFRAAQAGLIPRLVDAPDELTSSNAVAANLENVVVFAGPAIGAGVVALVDVQAVFWLNVASYAWSLVLVAGVRVPQADVAQTETGEPDGRADNSDGQPGFLRELPAGFSTVAKDPDLRRVGLLAAGQGLIWGALNVFLVVIAVDMLQSGPEGIGYLNGVMGAATVVGGAVVFARTTKGRLGNDMSIGVLGWSVPLLAMAVFPGPVTAIAALAVIGLMDPWVNLGFETIPQRIAPERVISRVYAAVESALIGAMALGAAIAPVMIDEFGYRPSLAILGGLVTAYAASTLPPMRRLDSRLRAPSEVPILRRIALFAPLSPPVVETLARRLDRVEVSAGRVVVAEGEPSERFFVIESGTVEVTQQGRVLRTESAGEFFGEIGLLRDVPRTATVTATTDVVLLALERQDFLAAVTGQQGARVAAEEIVARRLAV